MRYKENTGHLPFMKSKNPIHPKGEVTSVTSINNTSGASSGIFDRGASDQTDPEKAIATVQALPARTNSERTKQ
jgi:high-affinity iron transporter